MMTDWKEKRKVSSISIYASNDYFATCKCKLEMIHACLRYKVDIMSFIKKNTLLVFSYLLNLRISCLLFWSQIQEGRQEMRASLTICSSVVVDA